MSKRVLIVQGHPDAAKSHFCHTISNAYKNGARNSFHDVKVINIARLNYQFIRSQEKFESNIISDEIKSSQETIRWADRIVIIYLYGWALCLHC